jgi:hypothetical protein
MSRDLQHFASPLVTSRVGLSAASCVQVFSGHPSTGLKIRVSGVQFPPWPLCNSILKRPADETIWGRFSFDVGSH